MAWSKAGAGVGIVGIVAGVIQIQCRISAEGRPGSGTRIRSRSMSRIMKKKMEQGQEARQDVITVIKEGDYHNHLGATLTQHRSEY